MVEGRWSNGGGGDRLCVECCAIQRSSGRCLVFIRFGLGCGLGGVVVEVLEVAVWWCVPSESGESSSAVL